MQQFFQSSERVIQGYLFSGYCSFGFTFKSEMDPESLSIAIILTEGNKS